ncbi:MAG: adenosylmethionine decarboxylase [Elainellaceae cyanobacterium]
MDDKPSIPVGLHCILELYDCPSDLLDDVARVREAMRAAAQRAGSTLLNEVCHRFEPQGVTALALLAESHISIHTWPELGYAAVDVFTCGETADPVQACQHLVQALKATHHHLSTIQRNSPAETILQCPATPSEMATPNPLQESATPSAATHR